VSAYPHEPISGKQVDGTFKAIPDSSNQALLFFRHQFDHVKVTDVGSARVEQTPHEEHCAEHADFGRVHRGQV